MEFQKIEVSRMQIKVIVLLHETVKFCKNVLRNYRLAWSELSKCIFYSLLPSITWCRDYFIYNVDRPLINPTA
jgi:hypothetical protein